MSDAIERDVRNIFNQLNDQLSYSLATRVINILNNIESNTGDVNDTLKRIEARLHDIEVRIQKIEQHTT